jgi:cytochrome b subunit of formate dehydrogenase
VKEKSRVSHSKVLFPPNIFSLNVIFLLLCLLVVFCSDINAGVISNADCLQCHADESLTGEHDGKTVSRFLHESLFKKSVHSELDCTGCHEDILEVPHPEKLKPVKCSNCHQLESDVYLKSDHGVALKKGESEAASCLGCHGDIHALLNSRDPQSPVFRLNIPKTCGTCHDNFKNMDQFKLNQADPNHSYAKSMHGIALLDKGNDSAAVCTDCHGAHDLYRSTNPASKLYWQNIPKTCGQCHGNIRLQFDRSVHGQAVIAGKRDVPVCTDCHGEHAIGSTKAATSKTFASHISQTCSQCHSAERITTKYRLPKYVVETYMQSYHGLDVRLGSVTSANCASCHGSHDILPSSDPRSSISKENLPQTCGKCHAGITAQVTNGKIHSGRDPSRGLFAVLLVRTFYFILIGFVVGFMLFHNGIDWLHKLRKHYRLHAMQGEVLRMTVNERIQHHLLIVSFLILAYTGFALKYPESWWAGLFVGHEEWRSLGHRAAAVLFGVFAFYHLGYVLFTKKGREKIKALNLRWLDFLQLRQVLSYNLGKRKEMPKFYKYSYIEKIEYWALVWGSLIMIATGIVLVLANWAMSVFPKWFFDVVAAVHYYEAVLACLSIIIWHGYWVMFDPDEYPMKLTWLNGLPSKADKKHRHDGLEKPPSRPEENDPNI